MKQQKHDRIHIECAMIIARRSAECHELMPHLEALKRSNEGQFDETDEEAKCAYLKTVGL